MSERASMPTFVPRTVASFERAATMVARRVAAPVRMLATRALSFADRLVGTWAGASPMVGGFESGGARPAMRAAARGGGAMPLPRPWYEVDADEDAIWPQQAARAAMAAAGRAGAAPTGAAATGAAPMVPAAERGAAIARTNLTAPPERAAATRDAADALRAADAPTVTAATSATTSATATADVRAAEALGLHVAPERPIVAAPVARATTPLARALQHAAWVDQQLRTTAPVAPVARASAGYVFIAPADVAREQARAAETQAPTQADAIAPRAASVATPMPTVAPAAMAAPSVAAWSPVLPDPRLAAAMPTAIAQRVADFVSQLVGAQAARDAAPMAPAATTTFAPVVVAPAMSTATVRAAVPERTFVMLPPPAIATVSWRPGAAAARVEQLGARVDARVNAAWGEPTAPTIAPMATEAATSTRAVPAAERIYVAPSDVRATGPARMTQFVQQLVGVQAARATAPLPVQALVAALERGVTTTAAATPTAATPNATTARATTAARLASPAMSAAALTSATTAAAASRRAPERVALTATLAPAQRAGARAAATATMMPGALAQRAEQLGGVVGVRAASLSIDFVDPARLSMLTGEAPAMPALAPAAQPAASDTIMPAPRALFATPPATPSLTAEEWSLVATFPSAATAVQLAAARQAAPWSGTTSRATIAPERTLLSAIATGATPGVQTVASARPIVARTTTSGAPAQRSAPMEYVAVAPSETQGRLPTGRTPRGSFTWPKLADYASTRGEWTASAAVAVAEQTKQAAPGTPLWGVLPSLVAVAPSLAASTGVTARRDAVDTTAVAASAPSGEAAPARRDSARGDAPAMTLMSAAATREARAAARLGTREIVRADDDGGDGEQPRTAPAMPTTGGERRVGAAGVSNVRTQAAMPLMTGAATAREGASAGGGVVGPAARALELARPFLKLVEGGVSGDGGQRASAAPRFFEQPQPVVAGAPSSDSASRIVEALRSQPAAGSSDDRVSLADLTLIAIASATQQVAASAAGGGPSGGGGGAAAAPASSSAPSSGHGGGGSGNPAQENRAARARDVRRATASLRSRTARGVAIMGKLERARIHVLKGDGSSNDVDTDG